MYQCANLLLSQESGTCPEVRILAVNPPFPARSVRVAELIYQVWLQAPTKGVIHGSRTKGVGGIQQDCAGTEQPENESKFPNYGPPKI